MTLIKQISSPSHILNTELPKTIRVGNEEISIPQCLLHKSVQFSLTKEGILETCFIAPTLAYLLKAASSESPQKDFQLARKFLLSAIQDLVESQLISGRVHQGYMGLVQVNSHLDTNRVALSKRTWEVLCEESKKWKDCSKIIAIRYPNLGPKTTSVLELQIIEDSPLGLSFGASDGILDGVYVHPTTIKENFEGDADGDTLFLIPFENNGSFIAPLANSRSNDLFLTENLREEMLKKFSRCDRSDSRLSNHLSTCFDPGLIGLATYIVRSRLRRYATANKCTLKKAWDAVAPEGLQLIESVMDLKKGNMTPQQVDSLVKQIEKESLQVATIRNSGDPYHSLITSSTLPENFPLVYPTLSSFVEQAFGTH